MPIRPLGKVDVVIINGAGAMVICRGAVAVCAAASVTLAVKLNVPAVVGVPEIWPAEESVSPPGSAPALTVQVKGVVPPLAASVVEYAVAT